MKLLFDQHLSFRLVRLLSDLYPIRPMLVYLALQTPTTLLSGSLHGNCTTAAVEQLLREHHSILLAFEADPPSSFLALPYLAAISAGEDTTETPE